MSDSSVFHVYILLGFYYILLSYWFVHEGR